MAKHLANHENQAKFKSPMHYTLDSNQIIVEALAIEAGILLAKEMDLHQIIVESDSLSVIQSIFSKDFRGEISHIFHGILSFLEGFSSW